jgi:hypothetical protein
MSLGVCGVNRSAATVVDVEFAAGRHPVADAVGGDSVSAGMGRFEG